MERGKKKLTQKLITAVATLALLFSLLCVGFLIYAVWVLARWPL